MNKSDFLKKLAALLHILQEDEVRDILNEYEQHIDMKVAEGLTEAEAIRAFGSVEELATEILSAYHVKPDFKQKKENRVLHKVQDESKKALDQAGNAVKSAGTKTGSVFKRIWAGIKNICKKPFVFFAGLKDRWYSRKEQTTEVCVKKDEEKMSIGSKTGGFLRFIWEFCKRCIGFCIRCMYGCIFLCTGIVEAMTIVCVGILAVLLVLGYPVIGVTICVMGMAMSLFVITFYAAKKMRRR